VADFTLGGTVKDCIDKIEEFVKAGVKHFIFEIVGGPDHRGMIELIGKEIIPRFAE